MCSKKAFEPIFHISRRSPIELTLSSPDKYNFNSYCASDRRLTNLLFTVNTTEIIHKKVIPPNRSFLDNKCLYKKIIISNKIGTPTHPPLAKESRLAKTPNIPKRITNAICFCLYLFTSNK